MSFAGDSKTHVISPPAATGGRGQKATLRCVDVSVLKDSGGTQITLDGADVTVGRSSDNKASVNADGVSRHHARLYLRNGLWHVEDLGSTNGTRVNNSKVERCALSDGDTVAFGRACYKFRLASAAARRGETTSHEIDLGSADKTVAMRPGQLPEQLPDRPSAAPEPAGAAAPRAPPATAPERGATRPAARTSPADTGSRSRVAAQARQPDSNVTLWIMVALLAVVIGAGLAVVLGIL